MSDLKNEIKELHEYTSNALEKQNNHTMKTLTTLGAIFLPLTLLTGLLGMNILFIENGIVKYLTENWSKPAIFINLGFTVLSILLFFLACHVIFRRTRTFIADIGQGEKEISSYLNIWYLIFPGKKSKGFKGVEPKQNSQSSDFKTK